MTPSNHPLPKRNQSAKNQRSDPSPLNTARPTLPSARTPSVFTTGEGCLATPTCQSIPPHPQLMSSPPLSKKTPPSPPNSSRSSTTNRPTTSQSRLLTHQFSMSPTPPLHLSTRSHHHLCSEYALPLTALAITPRSPSAWLKPSSAWRITTSLTLRMPSHMASSPRYAIIPPLLPPQHAEELLNDPDRCSCNLEWRCIPYDACFIHDSCFCEGSGSFPPVKPQRPSWA